MAKPDNLDSLEAGFRLNGWRVNPPAGDLQRGARFSPRGAPETRHIEPKAMRVLLALAGAAGDFVSKDRLVREAWDGRPVSDDALTGAIHALRSALGDDPRQPVYIETRTNVGYRLLVRPRAPRLRQLARWRGPAAGVAVLALALLTVLGRLPAPPTAPRTVAVLPFQNNTAAAEAEHLSAAMTEALILNLARQTDLRVISRTSAEAWAGHRGPASTIAEALGADLLVEGSVQAADGRLRVVAQLIEPFRDEHLWADHYDRDLGDVLAVQHEVSKAIAQRIGGVLAAPAADPPPIPEGALEPWLAARYQLAGETVESVEAALAGFQALTSRWPGFAPAHLGEAQALLFLVKQRAREARALDAALSAARRFESLHQATADSHRCIGQILLLSQWDFAAAEDRYRAAIALNASDTVARRRLAWLQVAQQRYAEAAGQIREIRLLDPLYYASAEMASLLLYSGQVTAAIAEFERLDASTRITPVVLRTMAMAYLAGGRDADAHRTLVRMLERHGAIDAAEVPAHLDSPPEGVYRLVLQNRPFRSPTLAAGFHALLGDSRAALDQLDAAVRRRDPSVIYLGAMPELARLHGLPRFHALLEQIGVAPEDLHHLAQTRLLSAIPSNPQALPQDF